MGLDVENNPNPTNRDLAIALGIVYADVRCIHEDLHALDNRLQRNEDTDGKHREELDTLARKMGEVASQVGRPPAALDMIRASNPDLSHEEISKLDLGTGLYKALTIMSLPSVQESKRAARKGMIVGGGIATVIATIVPFIPEIIKAINGG